MIRKTHHIALADDDNDDCIFFQEALEDLPVSTQLTTVSDGVQLMNFLSARTNKLPDLLFLDLNMPRKSGYECLTEIKSDPVLRSLPVIILSTSLDIGVVDLLHEKGANHYIRKPGDFSALKKLILKTLSLLIHQGYPQVARENFIIQP